MQTLRTRDAGSAVVAACCLLPLWLVPAFCGAALVMATLATVCPHRPEVQFIWRAEGRRTALESQINLVQTRIHEVSALLSAAEAKLFGPRGSERGRAHL